MSNEKLVALTGVSGYIAGNLLTLLLKNGYQVNGTVRSLKNKEKVKHLLSLAETEEAKKSGGKLKLFESDLTKEGSFKKPFENVSCVFHMASPFFFRGVTNPKKQIIEPAINGTKNVLNEAHKAKTVKRIVLTSSMAAVGRSDISDDHIYNQKDFNNVTEKSFYPYSKTKAEETAWKLIKEFQLKTKTKMDLVTINPGFVFGPPRSARNDSTSINYIVGLLNGKTKKMKVSRYACVDVRDVAKAHLKAWEDKNAKGRYFLTSSVSTYTTDVVDVLKKNFPEYPVPEVTGDKTILRKYDNSSTKKLIGDLISLEDSLCDTVNALIKFGFLKDLRKKK